MPHAAKGRKDSGLEKLPEEVDLWWAHGTMLPVEGFFIEGVQQIGVYASPSARERLMERWSGDDAID